MTTCRVWAPKQHRQCGDAAGHIHRCFPCHRRGQRPLLVQSQRGGQPKKSGSSRTGSPSMWICWRGRHCQYERTHVHETPAANRTWRWQCCVRIKLRLFEVDTHPLLAVDTHPLLEVDTHPLLVCYGFALLLLESRMIYFLAFSMRGHLDLAHTCHLCPSVCSHQSR